LQVNLPIRYFFAQLQSEEGQNLTEAVPNLRLNVEKEQSSTFASVHPTLVNRGDGSYIARVRIFNSCERLSISLITQVLSFLIQAAFYFISTTRLLQEECLCPPSSLPSTTDWIEQAKCDTEPQLERDLSKFDRIDFSSVLNEVVERFGQHSRSYSTCHYAIKGNKIYRNCFGEYVGFASFADDILLSITRKMLLPDTQFIMNLGDYPLSHESRGVKLPIISWCGSTETLDIVVPTYSLTNTLLRGELFSPLHDPFSSHPIPWSEKKDTAIFRGRDSNQLRLDLARLSLDAPDLLDAGITRYFFFDKEKYPKTKPSVAMADFFKHRFIISVDGTVAAYRLPYLLAGDSLVLKSDSKHYEHFYSRLVPYNHFVPFDKNNVVETISNMKQFAIDYLQPHNIYCYYARFFEAYSNRLVDQEEISIDGMEEIPQSGRRDCDCGRISRVGKLE
ncbi:hypothetical protein PENTCL1PPCAC_20651, partial [Pristionchus entomophagus]